MAKEEKILNDLGHGLLNGIVSLEGLFKAMENEFKRMKMALKECRAGIENNGNPENENDKT